MSSRSWTMAGFREDAFDRVFATLQASAKVYSIKAPLLPSICLLPSFFSQPRSEIAFNSSLTHLSPLRRTRATCPRTACSPPASSSRCSPIPLTLPRAIPVPPCPPSLHNVLKHGMMSLKPTKSVMVPCSLCQGWASQEHGSGTTASRFSSREHPVIGTSFIR